MQAAPQVAAWSVERSDQAEARFDELTRLRWALMLEGRCPRCEALIGWVESDDLVEIPVQHADGCELVTAADEMDALSTEWEIPVGYAIVTRVVNGKKVACVGPVRLGGAGVSG